MLFSLTNPEVAILMMGLFLFAVLLGFPIAFTLMAMGIGFGYYAYYDPALMDHIFDNRIFSLFVKNTYTVMDNNVLTAVPLFLFMGYLVERAWPNSWNSVVTSSNVSSVSTPSAGLVMFRWFATTGLVPIRPFCGT